MGTVASVVRATIQAAAAVVVATNSLRTPSAGNRRLLVVAAFVIAILAVYEPIRISRKERRDARARVKHGKVLSALGAALSQIEEVTALSASEIGLQAFVIELKGWNRKKVLARLARLRLAEMQPPSEIEWVEGKGVIGECWRVRRYHDFNFDEHHSDQQAWDEGKWASLPESVTMGMSWTEFEQVRGRYGVIGAFPIVHAETSKLLGILAVDGGPGNYDNLTSGPVRKACASAAARIADLFTE
ncbi:hypothetical protein [Streptomyces aureus]